MRAISFLLLLVLLPVCAGAETFVLTNGDKITGTKLGATNGTVTIRTGLAGTLAIPETAIVDPDAPPADTRVRGTVSWDRSVSAGFGLTRGNSSLLNFNGAVKFDRNDLWVDEILLQFAWDYRTDAGEMIYNKLEGKIKYGYSVTKKFYVFSSGDFLRNYATSLNYSLFPKIGFGYWIADLPNVLQCMLELSGGYSYADYETEIDKMTQVQFRAFVKWTVSQASFGEDFKAIGSPGDWTDWKFDNSVTAGVKIVRALSLKFTYRFQYDTRPAEDNVSDDHSLSTQLEWKF